MDDERKEAKKEKSNLRLRIITGAVYITVLSAFFLLKLFVWIPTPDKGAGTGLRVGNLLFDILVLLFTGIGTWEMLRAFKDKLLKTQKTIVMVFALLLVAVYSVSDFVFADILGIHLPDPGGQGFTTAQGRNYSMHITFGVLLTAISVLMALLVFKHEKVSLESTGYALFSLCYPSLFLVILSVCNHLELYSELAILFVFVICPAADTFAFLFGKLFGRALPKKLAPNISPKKTLIGGLGGLLGGAVGAVAVFFISYGISFLDDAGVVANIGWNLDLSALNFIFFIALGILTAAFSQFGDLVESAVKRKFGIKDMGRLLPGHGGLLDRIDSTLYSSLIVATLLIVRIMIVG